MTDAFFEIYRKGGKKKFKDYLNKLEDFSERIYHYISNRSDCTKDDYIHFMNDKGQPLSIPVKYYQAIERNEVHNWFLRDKREMSGDAKNLFS